MLKKLKEVINGLGLVVAAFVMMFVAIAGIYLFTAIFHTGTK